MANFYTGHTSDTSQLTDYSYERINGRPSHLIPQSMKGKDWIIQMTKAIYMDYNRYYPNLYFNNRAEYDENIVYIQGLQNERYQDRYDQNQSHTANNTSINYDKRVLNLVSKYFRILKGKLSDIKFQITVTPQSALARQHEEEYFLRLSNLMKLRDIAKKNNMQEIYDLFEEIGETEIPEDDLDIRVQMQMSKPRLMSMEIELYLRWLSYLSNLDQKLEEADYDLLACGTIAFEERIDANGNPISERVDPRTLLVGFSNAEDFRDISEVGKFRMITINDIAKECKGDLSEDDLKDIEKSHMGKYGNDNLFLYNQFGYYNGSNPQDSTWGKFRALVLDLYFYSWDEAVTVIRKNKDGNKRYTTKNLDYFRNNESDFKKKYPDSELYRSRKKNIYKCTWIVGTDYVYDYGLLRKDFRTVNDPIDTRLPIIIMSPLIKNGRTVPLIREIIGVADSANLKWQKMQDAIAHARPPGFEFDVDSLYESVKGLSKDGYDYEKTFDMMVRHNIIPTSRKSLNGAYNGAKPYEERYGGLGPDFSVWFEGLMTDIRLLQEITGFSNVASGGDVQYTGKQVAELATATADYSIRHLFEGKRRFYENLMQLKTLLGMDAIIEGKAFGIRSVLGEASDVFRISPEASVYQYGIRVEFKPDRQQWMEVDAFINRALATPVDQGGITAADAIRIKECETIKEAYEYLYYTIKKNIRNAEKKAMEMQKQKSQLDQQSNMAASQNRLKEVEQEVSMKSQLVVIEEQEKRKTLETEFLYNLELKKLDGLIKGDHIVEKGTIEKEVTDIKAKYNMDRLKQPQ